MSKRKVHAQEILLSAGKFCKEVLLKVESEKNALQGNASFNSNLVYSFTMGVQKKVEKSPIEKRNVILVTTSWILFIIYLLTPSKFSLL